MSESERSSSGREREHRPCQARDRSRHEDDEKARATTVAVDERTASRTVGRRVFFTARALGRVGVGAARNVGDSREKNSIRVRRRRHRLVPRERAAARASHEGKGARDCANFDRGERAHANGRQARATPGGHRCRACVRCRLRLVVLAGVHDDERAHRETAGGHVRGASAALDRARAHFARASGAPGTTIRRDGWPPGAPLHAPWWTGFSADPLHARAARCTATAQERYVRFKRRARNEGFGYHSATAGGRAGHLPRRTRTCEGCSRRCSGSRRRHG